LGAFDSPVDIGTLHVKLGLVIGGEVRGSSEQIVPVGRVQPLSEDVVHGLALLGQLSRGADVIDEGRSVSLVAINGVTVTVPESLLHVDQFRSLAFRYG
jgi:hypothetical protein